MNNTDEILLKVEALSVFYGESQALWDVSLDVVKGGITAVIGSNGAGKSTLLKALAGLLEARVGSVIFMGESINSCAPYQRVEAGISLVPESRRLFPAMTIRENLEIGAYVRRARADAKRNLESVFELFPILKERANQLAGTMSGGEQQMAAIARGMMSDPVLLMLDEPSQGLAPLVIIEVFKRIQELNERGVTILLIEQNVHHALKIAGNVFVLDTGAIVMQGKGMELKNDEHIRKAYLGL